MSNLSKNKESRSDKIKATKKRLATAQDTLDRKGTITCINRAGPKNYNVIKDFEVVKNYKQRRSARAFIERLSLSLSL